MYDLLKKLFQVRHRRITVFLLDDTKPDTDNSYKIKPLFLFTGLLSLVLFVILITTLFLMLTPFGSLLYSTEDNELRERVIEVSSRVAALQDSLERRDMQLNTIQAVMRQEQSDSVLQVDKQLMEDIESNNSNEIPLDLTEVYAFNMLTPSDIIFSDILKKSPEFPALFPVQGTLTRNYQPEANHFGIDIATTNKAVFKAVADGTVINSGWTINSGYVIYIQHADGMLSVYKHCSELFKKDGDIVLKGEDIGIVGNTGLLSTGPHLHFELWKDGVSQNPLNYLVK